MNTFRLQLRFLAPLFLVIALTAYLTVPLVDQFSLRWTVRDLNSRSHLIANTISDSIFEAVTAHDLPRLESLFSRLIMDERVLGVGICDLKGRITQKTTAFPGDVSCSMADRVAALDSPTIQLPRGRIHIAAEPLHRGEFNLGSLILVHDLSYAEKRGEDTRQYLILFFVLLGSVIALITVITAHLSLRGWVAGTKALLRGEGCGA